MLLLLPRDPLAPRRVDEHFAPEAAAARELGVPAVGDAVHRGWMLRSEEYAARAGELAARDVVLRTSAEQYRTAHELPGWYPALAGVTPESRWDTDGDAAWLGSGGAVLRDHTKSLKHSWAEACHDVTDTAAARRVRDHLLELRARRVVELGDGQVSDRPVSCPAADLVSALAAGSAR